MNKIILLGRLCAEPETRHTQASKQVTSFRLAVNRGMKPVEGQPDADFFNCTAWERTAEFVSKYFHKGQQVVVEGRMQNNDYIDKDNVKHFSMQLIVERAYFADSKKDDGQGYQQADPNAPAWEQPAQQPPQQQGGYVQQQPPQHGYQQQGYQQQGPSFGPQGQQPPPQGRQGGGAPWNNSGGIQR